ncbi:MAG: O-antigen ligase family protein, partial [Thermodesulfovibrio sp.]|nr:O-antigen ligase family protein [Thermodesulfovibrio sp.]
VTGEVIELRFGLPRIAPLNIHPNMLGLYSLLFFILDFGISYKINFKKLLLLVGIFFSVSRMVWMSFILSILFLFFQLKVRNRVVYGLLFFILFGVIVLPKVIKKTQIEYLSESYYRGYVLKKYLEIYKDHPILGVGPGMYGGV